MKKMKNKKLLTVLLGTMALCFVFASCKKGECVCTNQSTGKSIFEKKMTDMTQKDCKKWELNNNIKCGLK
jgi:hypothetical protein